MAEAAFSEDGKYFSTITNDGRLRIWDTETNVLKQEYTPDLHLTSPPSCLQWFSVTQSGGRTQNQSKRKSFSEYEVPCVALGTTSGKILIYSVTEAKVETVLADEKNSEINKKTITALDWHRKYGLFSCNKESLVQEWDLQSGSTRYKYNMNIDNSKQASSVSAIKIIPHSQKTSAKFLITASTQLRVWRLLDNEAEIIKCLGHSASPKALLSLASLNNTCWLIEGSQNERLLSFWDVTITSDSLPQLNGEGTTPSKKKRKKSLTNITIPTPMYNFVLEDAPKTLDFKVGSEDGGTKLNLAAATRSGVVHYYGHMLNGTSTKPIKPSVTIQVTTPAAQPLPVQCCHLPPTGDIMLGYSNYPAMIFELITVDLRSKTQVLIRGEGKETKKKNKQAEVNKVRGEPPADVTYLEPMGGVSRKRATPGGKVEVPMEERLANLTVDARNRGDGAVHQNMARLLMQGLHSKDKKLIETVLSRNKASVATRTVSGLPADYVPLLLQQLCDMATNNTSHCIWVCTWLSAVLKCHAALLLATVNSTNNNHLTQLLAIFTHRRSHLCQLLNLKGRLELTMTQRESREQSQPDEQPILEYKDSSSDEEMEVEHNSGSEASVQSWEGRGSAAGSGGSGGGSDSD